MPPFRILSLDGGGSKGVYSLGVLIELEKKLGAPLRKHFDLIYGTSTGAIIAASLGLDISTQDILKHYLALAPEVMTCWTCGGRAEALSRHLSKIFKKRKFADFKVDIGIVALNCETKEPLIFKSNAGAAHGMKGTFDPGFGCTIAEATQLLPPHTHSFPKRKLRQAIRGPLLPWMAAM